MVGWQRPGASWQRQKLLGAGPASQWGHRGRREGEQIRSRGENWDRFSCRCWDNGRTNDLIVGAFGGDSGGGGAAMGWGWRIRDHRVAGFELQRQTSWHMPTWTPWQTQEVFPICNSCRLAVVCVKDAIRQEFTHDGAEWLSLSYNLQIVATSDPTFGLVICRTCQGFTKGCEK